MKITILIICSIFAVGACSGGGDDELDWDNVSANKKEQICSFYNNLRETGVDDVFIINDLIERQDVDEDTAYEAVRIMQAEC
jgi:hypothetical protein